MLTNDELLQILYQKRESLIEDAYSWVCDIQNQHSSTAINLNPKAKDKFKIWFSGDTLDDAKIKIVPKVYNPQFLKDIQELVGISLFNYEKSNGVTFGNLILLSKENIAVNGNCWMSTLFHELVHVVQFKMLGLKKFNELYVDGTINEIYINGIENFRYENIPLEKNAYNLQGRFKTFPNSYFSVEEDVRNFLQL